jgi:hypothetical protein
MSDDRTQKLRRLLLARIAQHGFTFQQVIGAGDYTHTLGLPEHIGHPELVVCGVRAQPAIRVIHAVVEQLRATPSLEGRVIGALRDDLPVWIATLPDETVAEHLDSAMWWRERHDDQPATAKQIIICDPAGKFPWESGCQPHYGRLQALLMPEVAVREPHRAASDIGGH